jgi:hypothetical protein
MAVCAACGVRSFEGRPLLQQLRGLLGVPASKRRKLATLLGAVPPISCGPLHAAWRFADRPATLA